MKGVEIEITGTDGRYTGSGTVEYSTGTLVQVQVKVQVRYSTDTGTGTGTGTVQYIQD